MVYQHHKAVGNSIHQHHGAVGNSIHQHPRAVGNSTIHSASHPQLPLAPTAPVTPADARYGHHQQLTMISSDITEQGHCGRETYQIPNIFHPLPALLGPPNAL